MIRLRGEMRRYVWRPHGPGATLAPTRTVNIGSELSGTVARVPADLMQVPYRFNPGINRLSYAFSAAIGCAFGHIPVRRAVQLDPIAALRHE